MKIFLVHDKNFKEVERPKSEVGSWKSELSVGQHVINRKIYLTETATSPTFARRATLCVKAMCHPNGWDCVLLHTHRLAPMVNHMLSYGQKNPMIVKNYKSLWNKFSLFYLKIYYLFR